MDSTQYPFDIIGNRFPVSTTEPAADIWFNRGLSWVHAFNHEEAVLCFRAAAAADPGFAMAWWGVALASGPFMNLPWDALTLAQQRETLHVCHESVTMASQRVSSASPVEAALIGALSQRFPAATVPDAVGLVAWETAYADAMLAVQAAHPDDPHVAALAIDAQIMLSPWAIWDVPGRCMNPAARAPQIHHALAASLAGSGADHIGVLHYDIHAHEMSPSPEKALPSAQRLEALVPADAAHLQHMPAHIYALCGDFEGAGRVSRRAVETNRRYMRDVASIPPFYRTALCHDAHMLMFSGMQTGNAADAMAGSDMIAQIIDGTLTTHPETAMQMTLEGYFSTRRHALVRFGRWQQILDTPFEGRPEVMPVAWAMHHYARAVAFAALGDTVSARGAISDFDQAFDDVPPTHRFFNNSSRDTLGVASAMMRGELAYREGRHEEAFALLQQAALREDALIYNEPRAWMHPPRHALGALLAEQGEFARAAASFEIDLGLNDTLPRPLQNRGNIWALQGLAECWQTLGDPRLEMIIAQRDAVLALADQPIVSACFCRTGK